MNTETAHPFAFIRGSIVPIADAQVSVMANALQYGIGIFDGIRTYKTVTGPAIFRLDNHITRFLESAKTLRMPHTFNHAQIKAAILDLARKNNLQDETYIRPFLYRSDIAISPGIAGEYDLAIYMLPITEKDSNDQGITAIISSWQRNADNALPPRTKASGGYINSALAIHDARTAGFDNAIFLDSKGNVSEGAVMNIFLVKNGRLITPAADADILEGITRRTVLELTEDLGVSVDQRIVTRSELYTADEVFFCGTAVEIQWCRSIDHVEISKRSGVVTKQIQPAFKELTKTHPELFTEVTQ